MFKYTALIFLYNMAPKCKLAITSRLQTNRTSTCFNNGEKADYLINGEIVCLLRHIVKGNFKGFCD